MLLYYLFWMLLGLFLHFYIIFGTNLLTGGPAQIVVFLSLCIWQHKDFQCNLPHNTYKFPLDQNQELYQGQILIRFISS